MRIAGQVCPHSVAFQCVLQAFPEVVRADLPHEPDAAAEHGGGTRAVRSAAADRFNNRRDGSFAVLE